MSTRPPGWRRFLEGKVRGPRGEGRQASGSLVGEATSDLEFVDCVDPVKVFRDDACFIALQVADEVPGEVQGRKCLDLFEPFLDVVFAEIALPRGSRLADGAKWLFFADGEQTDAFRVAVRLGRRFAQQITD